MQVQLLEGAGSGPSAAAFLGRVVEPPVEAAAKNSLRLLEDMGAIEEETEALTKLGRHLAALPLPPRVGKMLLLGVMFGWLDPILTVACCMPYRCATNPLFAATLNTWTLFMCFSGEGGGGGGGGGGRMLGGLGVLGGGGR